MALIIGVVSQKGGVGKSTLARLIAREYANAGWTVKIADLDISQGTSYGWHVRRLRNNVKPELAVEQFGRVGQALKVVEHYDLIVLDGPPHSTAGTLDIARASDLILLPTGLSLDDLEPTVRLAHELKKKDVPTEKIAVVLCRIGESETEFAEATEYVKAAGYRLLPGGIPERTAYRRASDLGRAVTETTYPSLNHKADEVVQSIVNLVQKDKGKKGK